VRTRGVLRIHLVKVGAAASLPQGKRELGAAWLPMAMRFASCQSARLGLPFSSHGLSNASLERELVIAMVSGSTTPVEMRKIAQLASTYEWK